MILSNDYANNYLNFLMSKTSSLTAPNQVWLGLSTNNPEADGSFSEVSGNNYGRVLISIKGEAYPEDITSASNRALGNKKQISFPKASAQYTVKGVGLFSVENGGSPFAYGALTNADGSVNENGVEVAEGAVPLFEPSAFGISAPNGAEA